MKTISRIGRGVVTLASLLFAGLGLELWFAPEQAVQRLPSRPQTWAHDAGCGRPRWRQSS